MNAMAATTRMTAAEFLALPLPEHERLELIDGEVVVQPDPLMVHQLAVGTVFAELRAWCRAAPDRGLAVINVDTGLDDRNVLQPDAQWFAPGTAFGPFDRRPQPLGEIVVEGRSPSTWHRDIGVKRRLYEQHGARELWLVDPTARTVALLRRSAPGQPVFDVAVERREGQDIDSPLLPGFALPVAEIFDGR